MVFLRRLLFFLLFSASFHPLPAAAQNPAPGEVFSLDGAVAFLEERHGVVIFYQAGWFEDLSIGREVLEMPLPNAVNALIRGRELSVLFFTGNVVIFPREAGTGHWRDAPPEQIVIGNTMEMGRYPRVTITGRVLDGATREPVFGAAIYSHKTGSGVSTDIEGYFSWRVPVGEHRLRITSMGYEESTYNVLVASEGHAEFQVFERTLELGLHTITAQRAEANIASTRMSVIRLDAQTLSELPGSMGERDIIRSFTMLPGIQSVGEFGTGFNVRGGGADQNLILVEDVPLFNSSHLFGLVSVVNPDMVTNVTLMKAGMPARYGERASSVIDIRKSGIRPEEASFKGGLGLLYSRAHLEVPLLNDRAYLSLGGRSSYSNWLLERMPDIELMNSSASFNDLSGVLSFDVGTKHSFSLFAYRSQDDFLQAGEISHYYASSLASLRWNAALTPELFSRFTLGVSHYHNRMEELEEVKPRDAFRLENAILYQSAKWHLEYAGLGALSLDFGLQAIRYDISPGSVVPMGEASFMKPLALDDEQGMEMAGYISGLYEFTPKIGLEAGLRGVRFLNMGPAQVRLYEEGQPRTRENIVDTLFYDRGQPLWSHWGLEPRLSLRYLLNTANSLKLSYNRNHQYINLVSNTAVMTPTDVWKLSDPYSGPMISDQLALGYYHNFLDHTLETSVEVYYRNMQNILEYRSGASLLLNRTPETDLVNAKGYNLGAEFYVNKKTGRLTGWVSYTLSASMRRTLTGHESHQVNNNNYFPSSFDRPHNLVVNANYHASRRWRLGTTFTYSTGRPVTYPELVFDYQGHQAIYYGDRNKYRLPDYHRLDVSVTFGENLRLDRRGKGSWTFSVVNVYGRKNPFSVFYKKDVPNADNNYRHYSLYKLYIIGRPLPTLTYNFSF